MIKNKVDMEAVLYSNYMKYIDIQKLTKAAFSDSNAETVNIYIDLHQMLLGIYQYTRAENYTTITASVINLCAHIRGYYLSRHNVDTNIFIVYSTNTSKSNTKFYNDYDKSHKYIMSIDLDMNKMVSCNLDLLKTLCPYLPNVYFISGTFEPAVIMYDIICKQEAIGNNHPNIIFSKSLCVYQIPAIHHNTVIFRNKKSKMDNVDNCRLVTKENVLYEYIIESRPNVNYLENIGKINGGMLSLIIALTNLPSRNITSIFDIRTAFALLAHGVDNNMIFNGHNSDIERVYMMLNSRKPMPIDIVSFTNRFKCVDLMYQFMMYLESAESKDISHFVNLRDDATVMAINNEYFKTNPLDLTRL